MALLNLKTGDTIGCAGDVTLRIAGEVGAGAGFRDLTLSDGAPMMNMADVAKPVRYSRGAA